MTKTVKRALIGSAVLLAAAAVLLRIEWTLPEFATRKIKELLAEQSVEVSYTTGGFDLLGNVRLTGVRGRWNGLLEFNARQLLLKPFTPGGPTAWVDGGAVHTGFLQLPLPDTIECNGFVQLRKRGIAIQSVRLKAMALVVNIKGYWPWESAPAQTTAAAEGSNKEVMDALTGLIATVCRDKHIWQLDVALSPTSTVARLSGESFAYEGVTLIAPSVEVTYPVSRAMVSADSVEGFGAKLNDVAMAYSAAQGALWRAWVGKVKVDDLNARAVSASARAPIMALKDLNDIKDIKGCVWLEKSPVAFDNVTLNPLTARLTGQLDPQVLTDFGLEVEGKHPATVEGKVNGIGVDYTLYAQEGEFYDLAYTTVWGFGHVDTKHVTVDGFELKSPKGHALGSLEYVFGEHHKAHFNVVGQADPLVVPWFEEWWPSAFEPFRNFNPVVALTVDLPKQEPAQVGGLITAKDFSYNTLNVTSGVASIKVADDKARLVLDGHMGRQTAHGYLAWDPDFNAEVEGALLPESLAAVYLKEVPAVLKEFKFEQLPWATARVTDKGYTVQMQTAKPVEFYAQKFDYMTVHAEGSENNFKADPIDFGFAGGVGAARITINEEEKGNGNFWLKGANLGQWGLMGPLSDLFRGTLGGLTTLSLNSASGEFTFDENSVVVPKLSLKGDEHAIVGYGSIDPKNETLNFTARIKTLGGKKPSLGLLVAPFMIPFTSVLEAHLSGKITDPKWGLQLAPQNILK